jgi:phosphatidylglycerol:prolipoprotein diacylglycerol transferase
MDHLNLPIRASDQSYWVDHINPYALDLGTHFGIHWGIHWYGLAYLAGLVWGWWLLRRWVNQGRAPLRPEWVQDFVLWVGMGMIIGGRLGYCFFYAFDQVLANPFGHMADYDVMRQQFIDPGTALPTDTIVRKFDWPFVMQVWNGGMASHGGIIGLAIGCWLFTRKYRISFAVMGDMVSAAGPIGVMFGRLANFINGELWGRPSHVRWAVIFPDAPHIAGYCVPRHPSTLYAVLFEGLIPLMIALPIHARHRRPGLTTGIVLACYSIGRFCDECFREPDLHQPGSPGVPAILGFMSKGQALTLPVFAIAVIIIIWTLRRPPRPELYQAPSDAPAPAPVPARPTPAITPKASSP